ncbi:hypothetical protein C8N46_10496 [Kordia periserrulae]|uniref:Uncharacterized protein n=1 Tax=Kordia periserrulae TaxID=701523 RepID=A0A2T6BZF7_9FLAO|nr:hypothetical protein [Kordia periserrulae]PTX61453.1 hypothetical protein C8N46_10496 [Kordia periserrulae]
MAELNFETVNAQIESLDLDQLEKNIASRAKVQVQANVAGVAAIPAYICEAWSKIGGIIKLIAKFPFLPPKWRKALELLIKTMDSLC